MSDIRNKVLDIFEACREKGCDGLNEINFFQSLVKDQSKPIDDTFKGKRYKNRFLNAVQREFVICFPLTVYEKHWQLDAFVDCVAERIDKPKDNLKLAKKASG